jgi:hypothetical protein
MKTQIAITTDQLDKVLSKSDITKKQFLNRLTQVKVEEYNRKSNRRYK